MFYNGAEDDEDQDYLDDDDSNCDLIDDDVIDEETQLDL